MISVLSSYKVNAQTRAGDILPELQEVCGELYSRGFLGVDVVLSRLDLIAACDRKKSKAACRTAADKIEGRIRACVEHHDRKGKDVPLQVCALASNFPGISSVDSNERLWNDAVKYLAVCLVVAHRLGTRVVEVVCGSCIHTYRDKEDILFMTCRNDETVKKKIRSRFAQGIYQAYCYAEELLGLKQWPNVGLAIEMEPDLVALARTVRDVSRLLREVDKLLKENGHHDKKEHFGINLDWGHILLACDSGLYEDLETCVRQLERGALRKRVMHAHISDHFPGAHRSDAPIGTFRKLETYRPLMEFHSGLLYDWVKKRKSINRFFSGAVGIELEACQDIGEAVKCRDALATLQQMHPIALETEKDRLRLVEHNIARAGKSEGWLQGINRTIFDALSDLHRRTTTPDERFAVLDDKMLQNTIREFLSASEPDARTQLAMKVACQVLKKLGADILAFWLTDLLDEEWGKNFYKQYRDHAIHSVYVYLLGLYLFAVSPAIRDTVYREDSVPNSEKMIGPVFIRDRKPTFFAKWALTSLTHDIGYPFEAGGNALSHARKKLRETFWRLLPLICALEKAPNVNREDVSAFVDTNTALLEELNIGDEINARFDTLGSVFFLKDESNRELSERTGLGLADFSHMVDREHESRFFERIRGSSPSLMQIFNLFREHQPQERAVFLDHGFISAAVLHELVRLCQSWSDDSRVNAVCDHLNRTAGKAGKIGKKAAKMREGLETWKKSFLAPSDNKTAEDFLKEVYFAVMIHNIIPERPLSTKNRACLYGNRRKGEPPILKNLRRLKPDYDKLPLLPFLLGLCDLLHEWHRFGFVNPLRLKHRTLSPLEVMTYTGGDGTVHFQYNTKIDVEGESFLEHKTSELNRQFGRYWQNFVTIEQPGV